LLTLACATDPAPSIEDSQPLYGATEIDSDCSAAESVFIEKAHALGKVIASTEEFATCIANADIRACGTDNGPDDPAGIIATARSPNDIDVDCDDLDALGMTYISWLHGHSFDESFALGHTILAKSRKLPLRLGGSKVASTIWHEAMHTHGYFHGLASSNAGNKIECWYQTDQTWHYQKHSVPYTVGRCIKEVGYDLVDTYYRKVLDQAPTASQRDDWYKKLANGEYTIDRFERELLGFFDGPVNDVGSGGTTLVGGATAVGDIDGDGTPNLVMAAVDSWGGPDYWRLRVGRSCSTSGCTFGAVQGIDANASTMSSASVALADFDGDGSDDVLITGIDNWDDGPDYWRLRLGTDCDQGGSCTWSSIEGVGSGASSLTGGGVTVTQLDTDPKPDVVLAAIDTWSGNDYWRFRVGRNCSAAGKCSWGPIRTVSAGGATLRFGGVAVADLNLDGEVEIILSAVDAWDDGADYWRYTIGSGCSATGACTWSSVGTVDSGATTLTGGNVVVTDIDAQGAPELLFTAIDAYDDGHDYWRIRVADNCNPFLGTCETGPLRSRRIYGEVVGSGAVAVANVQGSSAAELIFVGVDNWDDGHDYWRYQIVAPGNAASRSQYYGGDARFENNDTLGAAEYLGTASAQRGLRVSGADPIDVFAVTVPVEGTVSLELRSNFQQDVRRNGEWLWYDPTGSAIGVQIDIDLRLKAPSGAVLATSNGADDGVEQITKVLPPGVYYIEVSSYMGSEGSYNLSLTQQATSTINGGSRRRRRP